jgi:hypothetical protein
MDLNHARLPIPPLRRGAAAEWRREVYTTNDFTDATGSMQIGGPFPVASSKPPAGVKEKSSF